MVAPFNVVNPATGQVVVILDAAGNIVSVGSVTSGEGVVLTKNASPATPSGNDLKLYTDDGVTLKMLGAGGKLANLTVLGTLTMTGTLNQVNGDLLISSTDATGGFFLSNSQNVTSGADVLINENSGTSFAFGVAVTGDTFTRYVINGDGSLHLGSGTGAADVVVARSAAGIYSVTTGSFSVTTAGKGLAVKEGSNAKQGTAVLVAGASVVANTSVTANSRIFLTSQADGGTPGFLRVSARTASTSFTITSSSGTDTSTVAYQIFEPA